MEFLELFQREIVQKFYFMGPISTISEKYKKMVDWIAKDLGVTTLKYQTVGDMVKAIGLPKEKLCLYCWTAECPDVKRK